jgi:ATP-dependent Clp protease ATP-binding subunit ClpB
VLLQVLDDGRMTDGQGRTVDFKNTVIVMTSSLGSQMIQLDYLEKRRARLDIKLDVTDAALAELAKAGFDPVFGARPLKRAIQSHIENPLARQILEGAFAAKDTIHLTCKNGKIGFAKA